MSLINYNDVPSVVADEWENFGYNFGIDIPEEYVWHIARDNPQIPNFTNIYMEALAIELKRLLTKMFKLDDNVIKYHINSRDTRLSINNNIVYDEKDFIGYCIQYVIRNVITDDNNKIENDIIIDDNLFVKGTDIEDVVETLEQVYHINLTKYVIL